MKKWQLSALTLSAALVLAACGGGGSNSTNSSGSTGGSTGGSTASSASPITTTYTDYYYLQDLTAAGTTATFTDKGLNVAGNLAVRGINVTMTPLANGGVSYGTPMTQSMNIGSNYSVDANLPAISMTCQVAAMGDGTNGIKAFDVLFATSATRLSNAADLAGQSFSFYREDCNLVSGNNLAIDGAGNLTVTGPAGSTTLTAANLTQVLQGNLLPISGGYLSVMAYSYKRADGSTTYAVLMHASPTMTGLARGSVDLYTQQ